MNVKSLGCNKEQLLQPLAKVYPNINADFIIKIEKSESTLCNDCGHTSNNDGVFIEWFQHLLDLSNVQTILGMYYQFIDPKGGIFRRSLYPLFANWEVR